MLTTLPLECFVCREVVIEYFFPNQPFHRNRHIIITTAHVVTVTAIALVTCDVGAVFELIGATSACALAYILPPLCYIKLSSRSWKTMVAWACVVFGFVVMAISLSQSIYKLITGRLRLQFWCFALANKRFRRWRSNHLRLRPWFNVERSSVWCIFQYTSRYRRRTFPLTITTGAT